MKSFKLFLFFALLLVFATGCSSNSNESNYPGVVENLEKKLDPESVGPDLFQEVAAETGIAFTYRNGEDVEPPHLSILESLGGGVALIDYNRDGLLDVFLPGGGYFAGKDNKEIRGHPCKLYENKGNWKFVDVTDQVGLNVLADGEPWFYTHGAAVGDYDRDGWPDLVVTGWRRIALFHNTPNGGQGRRFVDVTKKAGLGKDISWATSAGWADLDGDRWSDLYICQYVNWSFENHPKCDYDGKTPDVCPPRKFQGIPDKLYRNNGDGTFSEVSVAAGLRQDGETNKGLGVIIVDVNFDGKPDIFVANDTVHNYLYVNRSEPGKIQLHEDGFLAGVAVDGDSYPNGSMGVDAGDPEGTGKPSLWCTNYENELHALYLNQCTEKHIFFSYRTQATGIAVIGQKFVGWGSGFVDLDHDGWEDIFIVNGHAIRYPTGAERRQTPVLFRNRSGKFKNISVRGGNYFTSKHLARGAAAGDLDNDGRVDIVVSHMNEPVAVLRYVASNENHWLGIKLTGKDHADVVGARLFLEAGGRKQARFAKGGGSYASARDDRHMFGLGTADKIDKLTVIWPNGTEQSWTGLPIDCYVELVEGRQEPIPHTKKS